MRKRNVVLTGLPRAGTTLTCRLLNQLPDTVALHEPIPPGKFAGLEEEVVLDGVEQFFRRMRRMIRRRGMAFSKPIKGRIVGHGGNLSREEEVRRRESRKVRRDRSEKKVAIEKDLGPDFLLGIKSPGMFSALLPLLKRRFPCYAVVRNPLAVLASWESYDRSTREGRQPSAEKYDAGLRQALDSIEDRLERQLYLLSWYFERFVRELPEAHVIRYEDMVSSGGGALSVVTPAAELLNEPLSNWNLNPAYDRERMRLLGERLLEREGAYLRFYPRNSLEDLLEKTY